MQPVIVCLAENQEKAQHIINRLREAGFSAKETSLLLAGSKELSELADASRSKKPKKVAAGLGAGAIAGGLAGLLLTLTVFDAPEIGAIIALGPIVVDIADALAGVAGATYGAVAGALVGLRMPDNSAKFYETAIQHGKVLISVQSADPTRRTVAKRIFETEGGEHISDVQ